MCIHNQQSKDSLIQIHTNWQAHHSTVAALYIFTTATFQPFSCEKHNKKNLTLSLTKKQLYLRRMLWLLYRKDSLSCNDIQTLASMWIQHEINEGIAIWHRLPWLWGRNHNDLDSRVNLTFSKPNYTSQPCYETVQLQAPREGGKEAGPQLYYQTCEKRTTPIHNLQVCKVKAGPRLAKLKNEQEDCLFYKTFKVGCIHMP